MWGLLDLKPVDVVLLGIVCLATFLLFYVTALAALIVAGTVLGY